MSLAWATIVVVILLTPGACFFAGLYAPQAVTRETVAISPLGQLAGIVCISFFLHGIFFLAIDWAIVNLCPWMAPVDLSHFFPILNAEHAAIADASKTSADFALHAGHILAYFAAVDIVGLAAGWACGTAIERQWPLFSHLARHVWLYQISGPIRAKRKSETVVVVSALSKVQETGQIIRYEGRLYSIYVKTDGAISYMTLTGGKSSILAMPNRPPLDPAPPTSTGTTFTPATVTRGPDWPLQQSTNIHRSPKHASDMLFLAGAEIHNFYFERWVWAGAERQEALLEAGRRELADAGLNDGAGNVGTPPTAQ
ncbi:hypothetical protein [Paraburkholderia heleia]|uniref:hypothetical protein n=1 Tax=Paraburkholderia heleia TaxID=634127 RepID=UPI002AB60403|nr:hypothetical protein [Paraburkholderia heleia]